MAEIFFFFFFSLNILFFLPGTYDMTSQCTLDLEWQYAGRGWGVGGGWMVRHLDQD